MVDLKTVERLTRESTFLPRGAQPGPLLGPVPVFAGRIRAQSLLMMIVYPDGQVLKYWKEN
jgi:hypothetical protein